jgi:hypothetical protein
MQPDDEHTLITRHARRVGVKRPKPSACSTSTKSSTTTACRVSRAETREWTRPDGTQFITEFAAEPSL